MADLRTALEQAFDNPSTEADNYESEPVVEETVEKVEVEDEPLRNEKGQFVAKEETEAPVEVSETETDEEVEEKPVVEVKPALNRPTTWKKEYLPIWDKLTAGQQLTPDEAIKLAEYSNQRESEYKKGVSTYKAEADNARQLMQAVEPFMPELQKNNINPAVFINNLGRAHMVLSQGNPEQKMQMFHKLASDYGIQLNQAGQFQQQDPYTAQLMEQLQRVNSEVSTIKSRYEQEEQARLVGEIERVRQSADFPHFDEVRETMAQLLEQGLANDLETAYAKAVRLQDDVWAKEQERLLRSAQEQSSKRQQVAKAKAKAVSPRSVTPNGLVAASDKKDRRSLIEEQLGSALSNRV
jgi:hypothetical protein